MRISNLIFTVLALAIPQALAAPVLVRRATPAKVGTEITLEGVKFKLESVAGDPGSTVVFHTKFKGVAAYAKQNINDSKFAKEIESTKAASSALGTGLYLASGTAAGSQWLVTKAQSGKPFAVLVLEGKLKDKATAVTKATSAVVKAQQTLVTKAKLVQSDTNTDNFLFSDDLSKVYPIDFGITSAVPAWNAQVEAAQKKQWTEMFDMTFECYKTPSNKSKCSSKSSKTKKSKRSIVQARDTQVLVRRATPAKVGTEITLNGVKFKLESIAGQPGSTAVFHTKFNGVAAYAKQNINDSNFAKEIESTKAASSALGTGLYLASGTASGSLWLVTKAQSGKPFAVLVLEGKLKDKATAVAKATSAVVKTQQTLVTKAKLVQSDTNTDNFLFSDDLSKIYPIDFGITAAVPAWNAQVEAAQKKQWTEMFDMTFECYKTPSNKSKCSSKSSKTKKSKRSV